MYIFLCLHPAPQTHHECIAKTVSRSIRTGVCCVGYGGQSFVPSRSADRPLYLVLGRHEQCAARLYIGPIESVERGSGFTLKHVDDFVSVFPIVDGPVKLRFYLLCMSKPSDRGRLFLVYSQKAINCISGSIFEYKRRISSNAEP